MKISVISGGQTGADQGALEAAAELGIVTGGIMPLGWRTLDGPRPDFREKYGMSEHPTNYGYKTRTYNNVALSDCTLAFASNPRSPGELCTKNAVKHHRKPYSLVLLRRHPINMSLCSGDRPEEVAQWIRLGRYRIVNIAGNSERTCPGIQRFVKEFMLVALRSFA